MRPLGTVWAEIRHHEQRAREIGEAMRRDGIAAVNYVTGVVAEVASAEDWREFCRANHCDRQ